MAYAPDSVTNPDNKGGGLSRSERSSISKSSSNTTDPNKTLDFNQAMGDFKSMFPGMDEEIIEAVLRANNGAVDATIDQLLSMSMGNEEMGLALGIEGQTHKMLQDSKYRSTKRSDSIDDDDLPPSYEQATKGMEENSPKPALPARKRNVMSDLLLLSPTETSPRHTGLNNNFEVFMPSLSPPTTRAPPPPIPPPAPAQSSRKMDQVDLLSSDLATFNFSLASSDNNNLNEQTIPKRPVTPPLPPHPPKSASHKHSRSTKSVSAGKSMLSHRRPYRKWNPPLLGTLPDDFLRLDPVPKMSSKSSMSSFLHDDSSMEHATHHPVMLSRRSSTPVTSTFAQRTSPNQNLNRPKRTQSFASSHATPCDLSRNRPERSSGSFILNQARAELSQTVLRQKMAVNEQRRSSLAAEFDPELAQQLEDEKLALALQNEEFLEILQQNEDFMKTLERDRMNATAFEPMVTSDSDEDHHEGYGEDKTQDPVHAFPFTKTVENENDQNAEFKKQLSQMGNSSRKKFQALARKFFSRKRKTKSPKQVLKESSAPSTLNLLEDNDDDNFEEENEAEVDFDRPTFEPLPGSQLGSVPSYKTVQRPPYQPDTVITHHSDDMV